MKTKLLILMATGIFAISGIVYGLSSSKNEMQFATEEICPLEGTPFCPKKTCPLAGTPECPFEKNGTPDCCQKK